MSASENVKIHISLRQGRHTFALEQNATLNIKRRPMRIYILFFLKVPLNNGKRNEMASTATE